MKTKGIIISLLGLCLVSFFIGAKLYQIDSQTAPAIWDTVILVIGLIAFTFGIILSFRKSKK